MDCAVFDTYVKKKDGDIMHFDIIVPDGTDAQQVYLYGKEYLKEKGQENQELSSRECRFCHIEYIREYMEEDMVKKGYYIIEMQGC